MDKKIRHRIRLRAKKQKETRWNANRGKNKK